MNFAQYFPVVASPLALTFAAPLAAQALDLAKAIPPIARPLDADRLLSGSLAIARAGEIVYRASYGMASYELAAPNAPDTMFCVASISKPITALAVARLVAAGKLALDGKVEEWIEGATGD